MLGRYEAIKMITVSVGTISSTQEVLDALLDDPVLLRAEFDAIIATSWADPPQASPPHRKASPVLAPDPGVPRAPFLFSVGPQSSDTAAPRPAPPGRQRSPPD